MNLTKQLTAATAILLSATGTAEEVTRTELDAINTRVQRVERVIDNQVLLNMVKRIEAVQSEVRQLRGENERLAHELNTLKARQREQYLEIDGRLQSALKPSEPSEAETTAALAEGEEPTTDIATVPGPPTAQELDAPPRPPAVPVSPPVAATASGTTVKTTEPDEAKKNYKDAFILLKQGKYDESIMLFEYFVQTYPDNKYAANAQYWLAEANYVSKRYPKALEEFAKVMDNYPTSQKIADAKLKLGFTRYELGQYEEARKILTQVRAQFPNTSVASLAQQRLERMLREGR